jgi:hypothetical protein
MLPRYSRARHLYQRLNAHPLSPSLYRLRRMFRDVPSTAHFSPAEDTLKHALRMYPYPRCHH